MSKKNIYTPKSLEQFYDSCSKAEHKLKKLTQERLQGSDLKPEIWYRGHVSKEYKLLPSLLRLPQIIINKETAIFNEFGRLSKNQTPITAIEQWKQLFKMQHLFIPTRLLDWTESSHVALYFALKEAGPDQPCLYLFSPLLLHLNIGIEDNNLFSGLASRFPNPLHVNDLKCTYLEFLQNKNYQTTAIKPPYNTENRIKAQKGLFTLHANIDECLDDKYPDCFAKIIIDFKWAHHLQKDICKNLTQYDIFPDDFGLQQHLIQKFSLDCCYDNIIAEKLFRRLEEDLERIKQDRNTENLLFAGIRGTVLGKSYIEQKPKLYDELSEWNGDNTENLRRACFIVASAGAGKTNYILNYIDKIHEYYNNDKDDQVQMPIVIWCALGQIRPKETMTEAIVRSLKPLQKDLKFLITTDRIHDLFRRHLCHLVIDGLDELARTQGIDVAKAIMKEVSEKLDQFVKLKIIIGCRDHIYNSYFKERDFLKEGTYLSRQNNDRSVAIHIKEIDANQILQHLPGLSKNNPACKIASHIPLFLSGVRNLNINNESLKNIKTESEFRELLLNSVIGSKNYNKRYQDLGRIAELMLKKRQDYLEESFLSDNKLLEVITDSINQSPEWCLFTKEAEQWRFIHQSIREYILTRSMSMGFIDLNSHNNIVVTSSSMDYESAEVYCFLKEMISNNNQLMEAFRNIKYSTEQFKDSQNKWNNVMRNYFEALGMIGGLPMDLLENAIDNAIDLLERPGQNEYHPYCTYMTRYNAARFLERIHPSGPISYCLFRMGKDTSFIKNEIENSNYLLAYAVRGFQKRQRTVTLSYHELIKKYENVRIYKNEKVNDVLKSELEKYGQYGELDGGANELATNISQALIRWLPHNNETIIWLKEHCKNKIFSKAIRSNLCLALWYRGVDGYTEVDNGRIKAVVREI